jgi:hypothetical protein
VAKGVKEYGAPLSENVKGYDLHLMALEEAIDLAIYLETLPSLPFIDDFKIELYFFINRIGTTIETRDEK